MYNIVPDAFPECTKCGTIYYVNIDDDRMIAGMKRAILSDASSECLKEQYQISACAVRVF